MVQVTVTFSTANAAFDEYEHEVNRIFKRAARILTDSSFQADRGKEYPLMDSNGNTIGNVFINRLEA